MAATAAQRAAARKPATGAVYERPAVPIALAADEFRMFLLKPGKPALEITDYTSATTWADAAAVLTGDIQIKDAALGTSPVQVVLGDQVALQGRPRSSGAFTELWRMRVQGASVALKSGDRGWALADDLQNLSDSVDNFRFVRGKAHKQGFLASEIVRAVARKFGVPIGSMPRTSYRIKRHVATNASPLDVITDVLRTERTHTGRRFVMRFRRGKLYITPLVRSALMYELGPTIIDGTYQLAKKSTFATVLTVHGTSTSKKSSDSKGHAVRKARKTTVRVSRPALTARFGVVHKSVTMKGIDSTSEARARGLAEIAKRMKPTQQFSFTHPGVMGIRRGQALRLRQRTYGLVQVCWVTEVRHSVSSGDYTMDVTVAFDDPFKLTAADAAAQKRAKAAAAKGRKAGAAKKKAAPKPAKAKARA